MGPGRGAWLGLGVLTILFAAACGGSGGGGEDRSRSTGGGSGAGSSSGGQPNPNPTPTPTPTPAGPFEVVRCEPTHGAQPTTAPTQIRLVFNRPVSAGSVVYDAGSVSASTVLFVAQAAGSQTGTLLPGQVTAQGSEVVFRPATPFASGSTCFAALTNRVRDQGGVALSTGSVSGPRTLGSIAGLVFQASFVVPASAGGGGSGGGGSGGGGGTTTPSGTPAGLVASFVAEARSDVWFIDFVTAGTFDGDLADRGLASGSAGPDAWARKRVEQRVLSYCGAKYLRRDDGAGVPGTSFAISFPSAAPAGRAGVDFNRHCIGGRGSRGTLGVSFFDPGNRSVEDNSPRTGTGVFSGSIEGVRSTLLTPLRTTEQRFVDGTYRLGQGSAQEDARFLAIQEALTDYGTAIGLILAHEVGHSVGLDHESSGSTNIMTAAVSEQQMSNTSMRFSTFGQSVLDQNLGRTR